MHFTLFDFFSLLGGLAVFLYGMQLGEKNLRNIGGSTLKNTIAIITKHRLFAYIAGLITTLITQSSSATTVMLVSLVSARLMTLGQSLGMILGSDLGTTFTVQLFALKFYEIAPLLIAAGFFSSMGSSGSNISRYGKLVMSMGFIFFGMYMMTESVIPLRTMPIFENMMDASLKNPFYGLLAGTLITSVLHSSAATLAITIAVLQGAGSGNNGDIVFGASFISIILGANLGTCVTAFMSTFKTEIEGVRVAWAHFSFKLAGTIVVFPFVPLLQSADFFSGQPVALQIALYHTFFNLFISFLFLPFLRPFERVLSRLIKPGKKAQQKFSIEFINDYTINMPLLAISQAIKEVARMSDKVTIMAEQSSVLLEKFENRTKNLVLEKDDEVDFLHESIIRFLTRISREELVPEQALKVHELVMVTTELEHIGDIISKALVILAEKIESGPLPLSPEGRREILEFYTYSVENFKEIMAAFVMNDHEIARSVLQRKNQVRDLYDRLFERHMDRLYKRKPESLQTTAIHSDLLEEIRRLNHFIFRIAGHIRATGKIEVTTV
ncbi:MAG TPA: Na/Pi cotransporter family protein [Chitinispirillaceae bacterium]|nr:Na/Pi cotransporter family protein [Chitinispirillaceae bacterium]